MLTESFLRFVSAIEPMNGCSPEKGAAVEHRLFLLQKRPVNDCAKAGGSSCAVCGECLSWAHFRQIGGPNPLMGVRNSGIRKDQGGCNDFVNYCFRLVNSAGSML